MRTGRSSGRTLVWNMGPVPKVRAPPVSSPPVSSPPVSAAAVPGPVSSCAASSSAYSSSKSVIGTRTVTASPRQARTATDSSSSSAGWRQARWRSTR